jgi:hypothetical protein
MRGLTTERLMMLLREIPAGAILSTNAQGNFKIIYKGSFYGYIDITDKTIHLAGETK